MSDGRPRILFVIDALTLGGAQRSLVQVANAAADRGAEVTLVTFRSVDPLPPPLKLHQDITLRSLEAAVAAAPLLVKPIRVYHLITELRRQIARCAPSCIVSFLEEVNLVTLLALPQHRGPLRVVVSERSYPGASFVKRYDPLGLLPLFGHAFRRYLYPRADSVLTLTERSAQFLRAEGLSNITVIPNPVPTPPHVQGASPDPYSVVAIGRLAPEKRFDLLIKAFEQLVSDLPLWRLTIYGEGPLHAQLSRQIERSPAREKINLAGPTDDPYTILATRPIFALSSDVEGFPVALTEAMASGCAAVATDCLTGPAELISHGENGLLVPRRDPEAFAAALRAIMTSDGLRARLGERARAIAERYRPTMILDRWWIEITAPPQKERS